MTEILDDTSILKTALKEAWGEMLGTQAEYKYWDDKRGNEYFHTVHKVQCKHGQGKHYQSGVYRKIKSRKTLKLVKIRCFSKKWKAIDYAYKLFCKATGSEYIPYSMKGLKKHIENPRVTDQEITREMFGRFRDCEYDTCNNVCDPITQAQCAKVCRVYKLSAYHLRKNHIQFDPTMQEGQRTEA